MSTWREVLTLRARRTPDDLALRFLGRDEDPPVERTYGQLVGEIERLIARGGMGEVFEVAHTRLQQHFAVKFLDRSFARNREAYARFRQEAEIAAGLNHRSIAQVFDFNTDAHGNPYIRLVAVFTGD